jgi:hypothetical protein
VTTKNQILTQPSQRFIDPRPDLFEDSALWSLLLNFVHETNPQLAINLYAFRCEGTRLKRSRKWGLIMEPILPGDEVEILPGDEVGVDAGCGVGDGKGSKNETTAKIKAVFGYETGWRDRNDYKKTAQEYLRPYHEELVKLFKWVG